MKQLSKSIFYSQYSLFLLSFLGFLDSTYLTILHYKNAIPPCTVSGCEFVLTSKFATVLGIPIALFGSFFYLGVLLSALLFFQTKNKKLLFFLVGLTNIGFVVSLVLLFIQAGILHHFCQYCLASEVISTALFVVVLFGVKQNVSD